MTPAVTTIPDATRLVIKTVSFADGLTNERLECLEICFFLVLEGHRNGFGQKGVLKWQLLKIILFGKFQILIL